MKITRDDVLRIAELAHLELSPEEISTYLGQLDEILTYIDKLNELDVASTEPMAQVLFAPSGNAHPEAARRCTQPMRCGRGHPFAGTRRGKAFFPCSQGDCRQ